MSEMNGYCDSNWVTMAIAIRTELQTHFFMIRNHIAYNEPQKSYLLTCCASIYVTIIPIVIVPITVSCCCTPNLITPLSIWSARVVCFSTIIEREFARSSFCGDTTWKCNVLQSAQCRISLRCWIQDTATLESMLA